MNMSSGFHPLLLAMTPPGAASSPLLQLLPFALIPGYGLERAVASLFNGHKDPISGLPIATCPRCSDTP